MKDRPQRPIMMVEFTKRPNRPMTPEQEKEFHHWYNVIHIPDLLSTAGVVSASRWENRDGSGFVAVYEFENVGAVDKYVNSERRKYLLADTEKRYGDNFFDRKTRFWHPLISKERD